MATHGPPFTRASARLARFGRSLITAIVFASALGSTWLWWRTSHVDANGHISQPNLGVNVPGVLLQATALRSGLHCVGMTGYPGRFSVQFERQTHIHEPGYARADHNVAIAGFRFVLLTRTLDKTDSILSPFCAVVFPYWFLVSFFSGALLYRVVRSRRRSPKSSDALANAGLTA